MFYLIFALYPVRINCYGHAWEIMNEPSVSMREDYHISEINSDCWDVNNIGYYELIQRILKYKKRRHSITRTLIQYKTVPEFIRKLCLFRVKF